MLNTSILNQTIVLFGLLAILGCTANDPRTISLRRPSSLGSVKLSTTNNFSITNGTVVTSGTNKIKFTTGYQGAAISSPGQVSMNSGTNKVKTASAGVVREQ